MQFQRPKFIIWKRNNCRKTVRLWLMATETQNKIICGMEGEKLWLTLRCSSNIPQNIYSKSNTNILITSLETCIGEIGHILFIWRGITYTVSSTFALVFYNFVFFGIFSVLNNQIKPDLSIQSLPTSSEVFL